MVTKFVNQVYFDIPAVSGYEVKGQSCPKIHKSAILFPELIPASEREAIFENLKEANWLPVSVTGMSGNYTPGDTIGSWRASNYTPEYAHILWNRVKEMLPSVRLLSDQDATDWDNHEKWEPFAVSSLFRFIKYTDGGWLVAHYDAPYIESADIRTLSSLVIYLDNDKAITGGATRYAFDPEPGVPLDKRDLNDLDRPLYESEVRYSMLPEAGTGLIFDHRLFHDAQEVKGAGVKTIIRTDILYRKV